MTLDPRCEPLLDELSNAIWRDKDEPMTHEIDEHGNIIRRRDLLMIIDKHLCPCGHNYRKRTIE